MFYVYALFRENGVPFYIGKGRGPRMTGHIRQAQAGHKGYRFNIIRKMLADGHEVPLLKIHEGLTEAVAHEYEIALIKAIGRRPAGPLVNETDGGQGVSGRIVTPEQRALMSARVKYWHTPEARAKAAATKRGRKHTPEARANMSASKVGKKKSPEHVAKVIAANRGRRRSPEARAKMAAAKLGRKLSPEARLKTIAALVGRPVSQKTRLKISVANSGKKRSAIALERMSVAAKKRMTPEVREKISAAKLGKKLGSRLHKSTSLQGELML